MVGFEPATFRLAVECCIIISRTPHAMDMRLAPLDTTKIEVCSALELARLHSALSWMPFVYPGTWRMSPEDFKLSTWQSNVMTLPHGPWNFILCLWKWSLFGFIHADYTLVLTTVGSYLCVTYAFECDSVFNNFFGAITSSRSVVDGQNQMLCWLW